VFWRNREKPGRIQHLYGSRARFYDNVVILSYPRIPPDRAALGERLFPGLAQAISYSPLAVYFTQIFHFHTSMITTLILQISRDVHHI